MVDNTDVKFDNSWHGGKTEFNYCFILQFLKALSFSLNEHYTDEGLRNEVDFELDMINVISTAESAFIMFYIISSVMHAFWLVLTYDLLEDRRIDDIIIKTFFSS